MNDAVVCNAGPLIALALLDKLDLLPALFGRVLVPQPVYLEVLAGGREGAGLDAIRAAVHLLEVTGAPPSDPLLSAMLDEGEAAVIALARAEGISRVLLDERKGRRVARKIYGLSVWGTARILIEAKLAGLLPTVRSELQVLQKHGYWLGDEVIAEACHLAGE